MSEDAHVLVDDIVDGEDGRVYVDDQPFTGQVREFFPDGLVSGLVWYSNGVEDGLQQVFYSNGQLRSEGQMDRGRKTGIWREWYSNGQLKSEAQYGEQRMPLTMRTWAEDGTETT
jgi:antitoxin component YwqK of YwqJK toxin-antitoxin module